ncbi:MAG: ankyrin repeat domain-containing protein [Coxiellaceae bacterium]|jgi:hypothetical protein|nr:ankyrin repeat domain-containing protein [Coxiellaceae bacterium]
MSLSKTIIYGSNKEVIDYLKTNPDLDIIDEYGYTPLIQTAIINNIAKTKILLGAGAKIDFTDLTGRTTLFWAVDNDNLELCKLCLKYNANPNAYSSGGQPLLVMPLMKNQDAIKKLLVASGAKIDFAQDFLNAKLIGHSFELEGRVDIVDTHNTFIEVELEGFYLRFTLEIAASSLTDFKNNFAAKKMRKYFDHLDTIIHSLQVAITLIRLQHYLIDIKQFLNQINSLLDNDPLILPISFGGHAITLIKFREQFIRCDRGEYGKDNGTVIYYDMHNPARLTKTFCRELLYKRQYPGFINSGLIDYLGLKPQSTLGLPLQKTSNCSWANVEALIPALMYLLLLEEDNENDAKNCEKDALDFYYEWREWNKIRSLDFCIQSIKSAKVARRISKVALLAVILFQTCENNNPKDRQKANKILAVLSQKDYLPILQCYAKTFYREKDNLLWKSFANYLEEYGIDIEKLLLIGS